MCDMLIERAYSVFKMREVRPQGSDAIWGVCFSPDGKYLATDGEDELILV